MNVVSVTINGIHLKIKGPEDSEYILKVAKLVEALYNKLHGKNSKLSVNELYVLTALNSMDEMLKTSEELKKVHIEKSKLEDECKELRNKLRELQELSKIDGIKV